MGCEMIIQQITNSVFASNTYLLSSECSEQCWFVDCGDIAFLSDWISLNKKRLAGIFITHTHFDHIYGLNQIVSLYPDYVVYTSEMGTKGLYSDKLNISHYNGTSFIFKYGNVITIVDNDKIELFPNIILEVTETPGHDWSCLTYRSNESLFTGDSYLPDYKVLTCFPKSNLSQAETSFERINNLMKSGVSYIYPGHGRIKFIN